MVNAWALARSGLDISHFVPDSPGVYSPLALELSGRFNFLFDRIILRLSLGTCHY